MKKIEKVSVSLRSIIHSYRNVFNLIYDEDVKFPSPYGVSFILMKIDWSCNKFTTIFRFRLLTEYHSFLF